MWTIAGHVIVNSADRDRYVEAHVDLVRRARNAPGCLDVAISADPVDLSRVNTFEHWETWDAVEAWRAVANAPHTGIDVLGGDVQAYEIASQRPPF